MKRQTDFTVADLSRALIREYLSQRGLKNTLSTFQKEDIDNKKKISKNLLIDMLSLKTICLNNKQQSLPQNTILQVLVAYLNKRYQTKKLVFAKTQPQVYLQKNTQQSKQQFNKQVQTSQIPKDKFTKKDRPSTSKPRSKLSAQEQSKPSVKFEKDQLKVIYQKVVKNQISSKNKQEEMKQEKCILLKDENNFRIKQSLPVKKPEPIIKAEIEPLKVQDEYEQNFEKQQDAKLENPSSLPRIQQKLVNVPPSLLHFEAIQTAIKQQVLETPIKSQTKPVTQISAIKQSSLLKIQSRYESKLVDQQLYKIKNQPMGSSGSVSKEQKIDLSKQSQHAISKSENKLSRDQSNNKQSHEPTIENKKEPVDPKLIRDVSQQKINTLPIVFSDEPQSIEIKKKQAIEAKNETYIKGDIKSNDGQEVSIKPTRTLMRPSNKNKDSTKYPGQILSEPGTNVRQVTQREQQIKKKVKQQLKQQQRIENKEQKNVESKNGSGQVMVTLGKKRKNKEESTQGTYPTKFKFDENFTHQIQKEEVYNYEPFSIDQFTLEDKCLEKYPHFIFNSEINYKQKAGGLPSLKKKNQKLIITKDAERLKILTFQSGPAILPKSWSQGFILSSFQSTPYGLKQIEGGPCGIIAAVQSYFLKHLLYNSRQKNHQDSLLRQVCLVAAMTDILYKLKSDDKITLAFLPKGSTKSDVNNLRINVIEANTFETAFSGVWLNRQQFIGEKNLGVAAFLFTVILTKGIEKIENEMDNKQNPLIGNHGHCTQQFVNLLLTGKATSNCFDGDKVLDDYKLKGVASKSQFGFLTIFQTLKYIEVGKNLKDPVFPIWVICKEFHYHVVFGCHYLISHNNKCQKFDIVYFDGLYNCGDRIRLTFESLTTQQQEVIKIKDLPLIQQVMMTKWGVRKVNWNGSTKIL